MEWGALTVGGVNVSPYTLAQETFEWPGNRWLVSLRYPAMARAQGDALAAALVSLYGIGTFLLGPAGPGKTPRGVATGTPLVNGAAQAGKSLVTDGWTVSVTNILRAGDYLQLGSGTTTRLYLVLQDVNSNAGGNATLDIWPRLREAPADNATIVTSSPKGVFRLRGRPQWEQELGFLYSLSLEAEEAF